MTYFTIEEDQYLIDNYTHLDKKTILENVNRTWVSIMQRSKKLGLTRPKIRKAKLKKLISNSIESAYWWGFIMADGYISNRGELKITLSDIDEEHLIKLSEYLEYPTNLYKQEQINLSSLYIMDKINGLRLKEKLQIENQKTYNPPIDSSFLQTPEERLAFFIGFVDGDGNITYDKNGNFKSIRIVIHGNWYEWWADFCDQLKPNYPTLTFNVNNTNARGNTTIYIGKKQTREFLINFIKEHKLTILERKWKINTH